MTRDEIKQEAENFFEWPTDKRETVTFTSCIFFAEEMAKKSRQRAIEALTALVQDPDTVLHMTDKNLDLAMDAIQEAKS